MPRISDKMRLMQDRHPHQRMGTRLRRWRGAGLLPACLLLLAGQVALAQPVRPYAMPRTTVQSFATGLQAAVKANNPEQVARHVLFPLRVNTGPGRFHFVKREDFVAEYYRIFDPVVKAAILKQDLEGLEQSAGDIALGDGMVTVAGVCADRACSAVAPKVTTVDIRPP